MDALAVLQASWAIACALAPGIVLARALGLGRDALERVVVGAALGRLVLALLALALAGRPALAWLPLWGVPWLVLAALEARGARWTRPPGAALAGPLVVVAAAALLVACIGGRSGLPDAAGALVFFGHHTTADPLTYTAVAQQLAQRGLPIAHPLVAGLPNLGQALFFGELVGLRFAGHVDPLDVALRVRPLFDVATVGLAALALARALGASRLGAALAGLLMLLGGGVSQLAYAVLHFFEWPLRPVEAWAFGTSFLLPVNPIAPALQTALAAMLVPVAARGRPQRAGAVAGGLGAAVLGFKLFLWPPLAAGLAFAALRARDARLRRGFAWAAGVAVAAALPFVARTLGLGARLADRAVVGVEPCPGCVPRFLVEWSFSDRPLDWSALAGGAGSLAEPRAWLAGGAAALAVFALLLGVRALALPALWRSDGDGARPGAEALRSALLGAALAGLALAFATATPPHPFNALQLAWAATFPLWIVVGAALGRLFAARQHALGAGLLALAVADGAFWIVDQGALARPHAALELEQQQLLATLAAESRPDDLVLEPSLLVAPHTVSPVAWRAGRRVFLSHDGAAHYLPPAERRRREELLARAFDARDPAAAAAAIRASGARFVFAPAERPLPIRGIPGLTVVRANAGGAIFRVEENGP